MIRIERRGKRDLGGIGQLYQLGVGLGVIADHPVCDCLAASTFALPDATLPSSTSASPPARQPASKQPLLVIGLVRPNCTRGQLFRTIGVGFSVSGGSVRGQRTVACRE